MFKCKYLIWLGSHNSLWDPLILIIIFNCRRYFFKRTVLPLALICYLSKEQAESRVLWKSCIGRYNCLHGAIFVAILCIISFLAYRMFFFSNWLEEHIQRYIFFDNVFQKKEIFFFICLFLFSFKSFPLETINWGLHYTCPNIIYFVVHCPDRDIENGFLYIIQFFRLTHQQETIMIHWSHESPWISLR